MNRLLLTLVALGAFAWTGCGPARAPGDKVRVVTTTTMITDLVREVGGDRVEITPLMGPGNDPHSFEPPHDIADKLRAADVIFYNGLHLEGKMADLFEKISRTQRCVAVAEVIPEERLRSPQPGYEGTHDPHVWFDVRLWMLVTEGVRDTLAEADPAHADVYGKNADRYLKELEELDGYVRKRAAELPEPRWLITAHDAFYYFGNAYGFKVRGLQGISTDAQISTEERDQLAQFIVDHDIRALFVESSVREENMKAVQQSVARKPRGFKVEVGGELYSDSLGSPGTPAATYFGTIRHNIDTIVKALKP